MKKAQGFTLIELIIVIIILGILAVTAAPKFINMQDDARAAQIKGLKGAIAGAMTITYGKAALDGNEKKDTATAADVAIVYGYPATTGLAEAAGFDSADFESFPKSIGTATTVYLFSAGGTSPADEDAVIATSCYVKYIQAYDGGTSPAVDIKKAVISSVTTGC